MKATRARLAAMGMAVVLAVSLPALLPVREQVRTVHSEITVDAPPDVVWQHVTHFGPASPGEGGRALFELSGLPRFVEGGLGCEAVGCRRWGRFEDGLLVEGTVTHVEPGRAYRVAVETDTRGAPDLLQEIGGPRFAVLEEGYALEPLPSGGTSLRFTTTYRVATRFNVYASLWLDFLMTDIQRHILRIEKARSEAAS